MGHRLQVLYYNTFLSMEIGEALVSRQFLEAARQLPDWELCVTPHIPRRMFGLGPPAEGDGNGNQRRWKSLTRQALRIIPPGVRRAVRLYLSPTSSFPLGPYLYHRRMTTHLQEVLATELPIDVMLLHLSQGDLRTLADLCRASSLPVVLRAPGPLAYQADRVFRRFMSAADREREQFLYRHADAICVISNHMKQLMVQETGVEADKVVVVPNGVDFSRFDPNATDGRSLKQRFGLHDRRVVGYLGGFWAGNDVETLLRAWGEVEARESDAVLFLVGDGPGWAEAVDLSRQLNLQRCLWAGHVNHTDVPVYLSVMDVGVGPYTQEALEFISPLKVMEYMTMALPVVATNGGQIAELVSPWETGLLYRARSVDELCKALLALLSAPAEAAAMGRRARQQMLDWYSWKDMAHKIMTVCQNVVGK